MAMLLTALFFYGLIVLWERLNPPHAGPCTFCGEPLRWDRGLRSPLGNRGWWIHADGAEYHEQPFHHAALPRREP